MNSQARLGQALVIGAIVFMVGFELLTLALHLSTQGAQKLVPEVGRLSLTVLLCYYLYAGSQVARWLTLVLTLLGGAAGILLMSQVPGVARILLAVMGIGYLSVCVLMVVPPVGQFLEYQKGA